MSPTDTSILLEVQNHAPPNMAKIQLSEKTVPSLDAVFSLIDSIPALVAYIDCNMILQYCNQPFKEWFSLEGDISGKSFPQVAGHQIFDQLQRHMGKVLVGERAHFQISAWLHDDLQYLDATLSPDFDDRREVRGFIFHSSDATHKNRTERALKDYFENASIGLHWVNEDGKIIWANPAELMLLGYSESEYVGHHISEFHVSKKTIDDILMRLKNREAIRNCEAELLSKDGSIKYVAMNSTVLWHGDKFVHTRCFTVDITEQKLAARAVMESEEKFRMIANLVPVVIVTTDDKGEFNFLSTKWQQLAGKKIEMGLGNRWLDLIHPDDRTNIQQSWIKSLNNSKPFEAKFRMENSNGGYSVSYLSLQPQFNVSGEFSGYTGILQDVSSDEQIRSSLEKMVLDRTEDLRKRNADLKRAEKELQARNNELKEINNQLSSFAHIASHDLQEPLRKIQTFTSRLFALDGNNLSEKGKEFYYRIHESSDRMRNLIQDLLAYSKSNSSEGKFEWVDLNLLLREVLDELEIKIVEKNARIEYSDLPTLSVIKFQFHQLFFNLLGNALKFSKDDVLPVVKIHAEFVKGDKVMHPSLFPHEMYHHITVSDNGIGFRRDQAEKIFEMFHRLHSRTEYEGTGIGLAICKKIAENHRGVIVAEGSMAQGAVFHIYIPVTPDPLLKNV